MLYHVRKIPYNEVKSALDSMSVLLGKGVFGKCAFTKLGPLETCVKIYNKGIGDSHFYNEVCMLSNFCHPNIPWLFGVVSDSASIKMTMMSYVTFHGQSVNVHQGLFKPTKICNTLTKVSWKSIILGSIRALLYLHEHKVIHNDIKGDNILLHTTSDGMVTSVLI